MKKLKLIIVFLIIILMFITTLSYGTITVTKTLLENSFQKFVSSSSNDSNYSVVFGDSTITINDEVDTFVLNYDLTDQPTFSIDIIYDKSMSYDVYTEKASDSMITMLGFITVADIAGIDYKDSSMYMLAKIMQAAVETNGGVLFNLDNSITSTTYSDAIEFAKANYDISSTITDDLFSLALTKQSETEDEYIARATLIVNTNEDFSTLTGFADTFTNSIGASITNNVSNNTNEANITQIPQTGQEINMVSILESIIVSCIVIFIVLIVYNRKREDI